MEGAKRSGGMNINLYIERLILDGLSVESHHRSMLQRAVESELERLLIANGVSSDLSGGGAVPHISAGETRLPTENKSNELGQCIAQAIYQGIG